MAVAAIAGVSSSPAARCAVAGWLDGRAAPRCAAGRRLGARATLARRGATGGGRERGKPFPQTRGPTRHRRRRVRLLVSGALACRGRWRWACCGRWCSYPRACWSGCRWRRSRRSSPTNSPTSAATITCGTCSRPRWRSSCFTIRRCGSSAVNCAPPAKNVATRWPPRPARTGSSMRGRSPPWRSGAPRRLWRARARRRACGPLVARVRRVLGLDVPPEPLLTGRNAGWALALAGVALAAAGILHSGKLMAQNDEKIPTFPCWPAPPRAARVVDADGNPLPGARVLLYHRGELLGTRQPSGRGNDHRRRRGRFAFTKPLRFKNPAAVQRPPNTRCLPWLRAVRPLGPPCCRTLPPDRVVHPDRHAPKPQNYEVVDRAGTPCPGGDGLAAYAGEQMDRQPFFPEDFSLMETSASAGR